MKQFVKRMAAGLCTLLLSASMLTAVCAQESDPTDNVTLPSTMTMKQFRNHMDSLIKLSPDDFASVSYAVFQGDTILEKQYLGYVDVEGKIPSSAETVYEWGSISKTFVWVSALQLWEQGKLDLERDIREYLPEGFFRKLSYDAPITMLNLMNHNAGWQETTKPIMTENANAVLPLKEALQAIEPAQIAPPGETVAYSNYGAAVAGYVIECISGMEYWEYVHRNILEPLGMEHTSVSPTRSDNAFVEKQHQSLKTYQCVYGSLLDLGHKEGYIPPYPAGAVTGTLDDLVTYTQAFLDEDAPLFEKKETQEFLFSASDTYGKTDIPCTAHGFFPTEYAVRTYGHSGATTSCQSNMLFDLESGTGLVVLINELAGNRFFNMLPLYVFGELSPETYGGENAKPVSLEGYYLPSRSVHRGMLRFITYLSALNIESVGDIEDLGDGLYQVLELPALALQGDKAAMLLGVEERSDGTKTFLMPSVELIEAPHYILSLSLLTAYVVFGMVAVFLLLIQRKLKKGGRWKTYAGAKSLLVGVLVQLISVLLFLGIYVAYSIGNGGIGETAAMVLGVGQMLCALGCMISTILTVFSVFTKKEKANALRYALGIVSNLVCVGAVLFFELYRFWGC